MMSNQCLYSWKAHWASRLFSALIREPHGPRHRCVREAVLEKVGLQHTHLCLCGATRVPRIEDIT